MSSTVRRSIKAATEKPPVVSMAASSSTAATGKNTNSRIDATTIAIDPTRN